MAECYCLGCGEIFEDGEKARVNEYGEPEMDDNLCPSCREALEVGRLVMRMPRRHFLYHGIDRDIEWEFIEAGSEGCSCDTDSCSVSGKTALEALKKGVGE